MEPKRPFSNLNWDTTPGPVKRYIEYLEETQAMLLEKIEKLEKRTDALIMRF